MGLRVKNGELVHVVPKFSGKSQDFEWWLESAKLHIEYGLRMWLVDSPLEYDSENPVLEGISQDEWNSAQKDGYHVLNCALPYDNADCSLALALVDDEENFSKLLAKLVLVYQGNDAAQPRLMHRRTSDSPDRPTKRSSQKNQSGSPRGSWSRSSGHDGKSPPSAYADSNGSHDNTGGQQRNTGHYTNCGQNHRGGSYNLSQITCSRCHQKGHYASACEASHPASTARNTPTQTESTVRPGFHGPRERGGRVPASMPMDAFTSQEIAVFRRQGLSLMLYGTGTVVMCVSHPGMVSDFTSESFHVTGLLDAPCSGRGCLELNFPRCTLSHVGMHIDAYSECRRAAGTSLEVFHNTFVIPSLKYHLISDRLLYDRGYSTRTDATSQNQYLIHCQTRHVIPLIRRSGRLFVAVWIGNESSPTSTALPSVEP